MFQPITAPFPVETNEKCAKEGSIKMKGTSLVHDM